MSTALAARVKRLERNNGAGCPACRDWPEEIELKLIEVVVEVGPDGVTRTEDGIPLAEDERDKPHPATFGPCPQCGRVQVARVVEISVEHPPAAD